MANDIPITIMGNITADPELRYTQNGVPVVNFTVAQTPRIFDRQSGEWKDKDPVFMRATAWRELAEHIAASVQKGARVIVAGNFIQTTFTDNSGNTRTGFEMEVVEFGPSLRYGTTQFTKSAPRNQNAPAAAPVGAQAPAQGQPPVNYAAPQQPQQQYVQQQPPVPQGGQPVYAPPQQPTPVQQQAAPVQPQQYAGQNVDDSAF